MKCFPPKKQSKVRIERVSSFLSTGDGVFLKKPKAPQVGQDKLPMRLKTRPGFCDYSKRIARAGGMREAREAGSHAARSAAGRIHKGVEAITPHG